LENLLKIWKSLMKWKKGEEELKLKRLLGEKSLKKYVKKIELG